MEPIFANPFMRNQILSTVPDFSKIEPFNGTNYKCWRQYLLFALEQLGVAFALTEPNPLNMEEPTRSIVVEHWTTADHLCTNHNLNCLSDELYNVYSSYNYAYEIYNALDTKYALENAENKKYAIANFLHFTIKEDMDVSAQIDEFRVLVGELAKEDMVLPDEFIASSLIEKLLHAWNDFKTSMKHKRNDTTLDQDWYRNKDSGKPKVNLTGDVIATVVTEVNLVDKPKEWVLDIGATKHICGVCNSFYEYTTLSEGDQVFMGNSQTSKVIGKGKILPKLTSGKILMLNDVLHVLEIRRNLVLGALLNKVGLKLKFEADKAVLTKNNVFIGK
ncbi:PREDICTED: uncharacterized protein LOC104587075 [Nelumbo nucifera]|uniref:Uncharacterized protein LOC104587075 n=1 Tax=Nelumbo nucifera TaxID=4432 RepID=A0A1U7YXN4_NELNU|nr:PREDICTED: uncharacterized protein LOC104587075 [Nelumbo nucifera]